MRKRNSMFANMLPYAAVGLAVFGAVSGMRSRTFQQFLQNMKNSRMVSAVQNAPQAAKEMMNQPMQKMAQPMKEMVNSQPMQKMAQPVKDMMDSQPMQKMTQPVKDMMDSQPMQKMTQPVKEMVNSQPMQKMTQPVKEMMGGQGSEHTSYKQTATHHDENASRNYPYH